MAVTPKAKWSVVKPMLQLVYDEPDSRAVPAQSDRLMDPHREAARRRRAPPHRCTETLAFAAFPKDVRTQIFWSNNPDIVLASTGCMVREN